MTYLLTFSCYGTHLHGDARGSWNDGAFQVPHPGFEQAMRERMVQEAFVLTTVGRPLVLVALVDLAARRGWELIAAHVRGTHVHLVLVCEVPGAKAIVACKAAATGNFRGEGVSLCLAKAIVACKAAATFRLNRADGDRVRRRWSRGGSVVPLRTPDAVSAAVRYVVDGQGEAMSVWPG